ncbi:ferritin [Cumulibacter soli]|uniref:ferritin n=1 Tax=Cumulibacter soli TaxID=2546344 RepID=UPI00106744FD|nr:ferritin [Cumulibacter soli]
MKMDNALEKAFCQQITMEFEASMVYRQLAIEMDVLSLPGMAAWLRHQADEEIVHANKFIDHLLDRDNHPTIGSTDVNVQEMDNPLAAFTAALEHERKVSEAIRDLYRQSEEVGDLDSRPLLNWFLTEQIEEEATVTEIVDRIKLIHDDGPGLLRLDAELGSRPTSTTED